MCLGMCCSDLADMLKHLGRAPARPMEGGHKQCRLLAPPTQRVPVAPQPSCKSLMLFGVEWYQCRLYCQVVFKKLVGVGQVHAALGVLA